MSAQVNSPNWGWRKIGFSVNHEGNYLLIRTIRDKEGNVVLENAGYEEELMWLVSKGVINGINGGAR